MERQSKYEYVSNIVQINNSHNNINKKNLKNRKKIFNLKNNERRI
jgi:hypothetical protein